MGQPAKTKVLVVLTGLKMDAKDAAAEVERLATLVKKRRHKNTFFPSKIDKFRNEVLRLKSNGATLEMLKLWLSEKRIKADISTISRWLKKNG
jgi:hypothetical protein